MNITTAPSSSSFSSSSISMSLPLVLTPEQVLDRMHQAVPPKATQQMVAMYSSLWDGITTEPALMNVPLDDHGFHRGHAVFDTANVVQVSVGGKNVSKENRTGTGTGTGTGVEAETGMRKQTGMETQTQIDMGTKTTQTQQRPATTGSANTAPHDSTTEATPPHTATKLMVYGLDFHIDRILNSAQKARIDHSYTKAHIKQVVLATVSAAVRHDRLQQRNYSPLFVRFWITAGRGDFNIVPAKESIPALYVIVQRKDFRFDKEKGGLSEIVSEIKLKQPILATIKTTNYLVNVLCAMEARDKGGDLGLQLDDRGCVAECSIGSIAFVQDVTVSSPNANFIDIDPNGVDTSAAAAISIVTSAQAAVPPATTQPPPTSAPPRSGKVLVTPTLDRILKSTTLHRVFELGYNLIHQGVVDALLYQDNISLQSLLHAKEVIGFGGGGVTAITEMNGNKIGDGKIGPVFHAIDALVKMDMQSGPYLDDIPGL